MIRRSPQAKQVINRVKINLEIREFLLTFALRNELRIMEKKLTLIIAVFVAVFLAITCTVGNNGKQAQISEIVPEISHEHICECDSLFGYKECDTLNFGGVNFVGINHPSNRYYNIFILEKTPITKTPYAIRLYSQKNCDWRKIEKCLETNVKNFNWTPWHPDKNWKTIDLPERFKLWVPNNNYHWAIGTQNGKEYFCAWYPYVVDGIMKHDEENIIITDLKLLKLYEKEKYESEAPERERKAREKAEREKNAQIFPI